MKNIQRKSPFQVMSLIERPISFKKNTVWSQQESVKYFVFLQYILYKSKAIKESTQLNWHHFKALSKLVRTRNPNQCRIYHKQMISSFLNPHVILDLIRSQTKNFQSLYQKYSVCLNIAQEEIKKENQVQAKVQETSGQEVDISQKQIQNIKTNTNYDDQNFVEKEKNCQIQIPEFVNVQVKSQK